MTSFTALDDLINKAEREGKWLISNYQGIQLTPNELRAYNRRGELCWGPVNWTLFDPKTLLKDEAAELARVRKHNDSINERIRKG